MRVFKIENNPALKALLEQKEVAVKATVAKQDQMAALNKELQEETQKVQDIKDLIIVASHEIVMAECADTEMPATLRLNEEGEIEVEIFDAVEEQKAQLQAEKVKINNRVVELRRKTKKTNKAKDTLAKRAKTKK